MFPPKIETARLVLRKPVPSDADAIFGAYAQDPEVTRYLLWKPHATVQVTRQFIRERIASWGGTGAFPYVIVRNESPDAIGMLELRVAEFRASFGYVLARPYWGSGLMSEALSAVVPLVLAQPSIYRVDATCDVENRASARVLEKAGLTREGRLRRYMVHPNISAEPRDSFLYAITR